MGDRIRVLVTEPLDPVGLDILRAADRFHVDVLEDPAPAALATALAQADALLVRSQTKVTAALIAVAPRLKIVGRAGAGIDNIDVPAATRRGIVVVNVPTGNTISAAEHTWALILSMARHIPDAHASVAAGLWERERFQGTELAGKTLGLLGFGRVGREVARRALAFGMRVLCHDPYLSEEDAAHAGARRVSLDELLGQSDVLSLHATLTDQTRGLIGREAVAKMKRGARLVNCSRGGIVDEAAVAEAVKSGRLAGAAVDVFSKEPPAGSPLVGLPGVIHTPHLGASTAEAQAQVAEDLARQIVDYFTAGVVRSAVNLPAVSPEKMAELQPAFRLAETLGALAGQLLDGAPREVRLTYHGTFVDWPSAPMTRACLKGFLEPAVGGSVNYVNAQVLLSERGVIVRETKTSAGGDFAGLLTVEVFTTPDQAVPAVSVSGTLFGRELRLVRLDEFHVDVVPEGYLLICHNRDVPGVIGRVGTVLGEHGINIAGMEVGRRAVGAEAVMVLSLDNPPSAEATRALAAFPDITRVRVVKV